MPSSMQIMVGALLVSMAHSAVPTAATHVTGAEIANLLKQMPSGSVSDQQLRMVDAGGYQVGVGAVSRPQSATQTGIEHDKLTEVYYVLEGAGTLVTGGTLLNAKPVPATSAIYKELTGPSSIGSNIQGGESRQIAAGDVVIIPAMVPHWFSDVQGAIKYLVVRIDPERLLAPIPPT